MTDQASETGIWLKLDSVMDFPGSSADKESACNEGDPGTIPGSERFPGEGIGYPLQYSCLENSMDRGAWQATVHGVTKSWTQLSSSAQHRLSDVFNSRDNYYMVAEFPLPCFLSL